MFSAGNYRYFRFNEKTRTVDTDYPKPISMWSGAPDNIKAALMSEDGCKVTLFNGVPLRIRLSRPSPPHSHCQRAHRPPPVRKRP